MVTLDKVKAGFCAYVDSCVVPVLPQGKAILCGGLVGLIANGLDGLISELSESPIFRSMNIVDGDMVDIEAVYKAFKPKITHPFTIDVPLLGALTFSESDVDRLYQEIVRR